MKDIVRIVLYGTDPVLLPAALHYAPVRLHPGVTEFHADHWQAMCASAAVDSAELHAALACGRIGPLETTKRPVEVMRRVLVPADSEEGRAALAAKAEAEAPEETTVTVDIPDDDEKPKRKTARKVTRKG